MKMRHLWRWPLLCSMLFGLASAGSVAAAQAPAPANTAETLTRDNLSRVTDDLRLHDRVEVILFWLREARATRNRPAALRVLAGRVERAAAQMAGLSNSNSRDDAAVQTLLVDLLEGADALRSASKSVRTAGLARIDGALHEHGRRVHQPSVVASNSGGSRS